MKLFDELEIASLALKSLRPGLPGRNRLVRPRTHAAIIERDLGSEANAPQAHPERDQSPRTPTQRHRRHAGQRRSEDKRAIYDELGVNLTYHQDG